jgi:UDP-N-acetylglucosamine 2-epimerase (non-hydrolysing)
LCAGLAAFHRGVRVAHVEAGLRTGDPQSPFPEEVNRCLLARIVNLHLAPTRTAASKLQAEGVSRSSIHIIGNTVVDAIYRTGITHSSDLPRTLPEKVRELCGSSVPFVLVTCHRRENFGEVMEGICFMLARLARAYPAYQWVFPVHLNPAVREPVTRILGDIPNLSLLEPVDYRSSLHLIAKANLVISDSGGIQEEAPTFGTPVVIMRRHTERMEGVEAGFATLAGQDPQTIEAAARNWLDQSGVKERLLARGNPYGDGLASQRIVSAILGQPVDEFNG